MAFTRKYLTALGIEADKVDEIINAHTEVTDALKAERDKYKIDAEKLPGVQEELDKLKSENNGDSSYKAKYEKEHSEFEAYKAEQEAKNVKANKISKYRDLLRKAGVSEKRMDSVLKVTDLDPIKLDKDGNIEDSEKILGTIKTEWSDFIVKEGSKGADVSTPPGDTGTKLSKEEIYKKDDKGRYVLDAPARQKALAELMSSEE